MEKLGPGLYRIGVRHGFMVAPRMKRMLALPLVKGLDITMDKTSFYLVRKRRGIGPKPAMGRWRSHLLIYLYLFVFCMPSLGYAIKAPNQGMPDIVFLTQIPDRPGDSITGSQFAAKTKAMSGAERQKAALEELLKGNVPDFLRKLIPVRLSLRSQKVGQLTAVVWVAPDYIAIGSDADFLRIPLDYPTAVEVANSFGCILPTRKMVDAIYKQATCRLIPEPLPPGPQMRSSEYYLRHRELIRKGRKDEGCLLGELIAGHKKDVVLTNWLNQKPGRIAIYGWQKKEGRPIQPLSTVHDAKYADYSHGIRLVYQTVWIDGSPRSILDTLQDKHYAPLLTYEGTIQGLLRMLHLK